jgi:antitoxin Phd
MKTMWTLHDAQNHFSKVIEEATQHGPQYVTRRGVATVVIVSVKEYEMLATVRPSFTEFLLNCPKMDEPLPLERQQDYPRSVEL